MFINLSVQKNKINDQAVHRTPPKTNMDTQNVIFEAGDTILKTIIFGIYVRFQGSIWCLYQSISKKELIHALH